MNGVPVVFHCWSLCPFAGIREPEGTNLVWHAATKNRLRQPAVKTIDGQKRPPMPVQ
jgi:hypothetical protein